MTSKKFDVRILEQAEDDLFDIYTYIAQNDSPAAAENVLSKLETHIHKLENFPKCGNYPKELKRVGVAEYRELNIKPYRIIYQIQDFTVYIHAVLDGRRNLEEYLHHRLVFH